MRQIDEEMSPLPDPYSFFFQMCFWLLYECIPNQILSEQVFEISQHSEFQSDFDLRYANKGTIISESAVEM